MKKIVSFLITISLLLTLLLPAVFALETGDYTWRNHTIRLAEIQDKPMFAPADMKDNERALGLVLEVPGTLAADETLRHALFESACLKDENGQAYKPGAAMSKGNTLTYLFAFPKTLDVSALSLSFGEEVPTSNILKDFVGEWEGQHDDIHLTFTVNEDGSGQYIFEQSGYRESYPVRLSADNNTFTVDIPADNALSITSCGGFWEYRDEVLTLLVVTTFKSGKQFTYIIPCRRVEKKGATTDSSVPDLPLGRWLEMDLRFILPGNLTWDATAADVTALLGENMQQGQMSENITALAGQGTPWEESAVTLGYLFQKDDLVCLIQTFQNKDIGKDEVYDKLCTTLRGMYGNANITDFDQIAPFAAALNIPSADLAHLETVPWCAWMLPDQNTLVYLANSHSIGIMYFNTARLQK